MTSRERIAAVLAGQEPDRLPVLGGWIAGADLICALTGTSKTAYWQDPVAVSIQAYRDLAVDGLIGVFVPQRGDEYRCVDVNSFPSAHGRKSLADVVAEVDAMPSAAELERAFDFAAAYAPYRADLVAQQERCRDVVWMPAMWNAGAQVTWYHNFGYEPFFELFALYPDRMRKLMTVAGARGRQVGRLIARAVTEQLIPPVVLLGEDICTQRGPMVSPAWLQEYWAPQLACGLEPLLAAGCAPVWHCDGDVRPLLPMLLAAGVQGFQGFQPECGMTLDLVCRQRTREGRPPVIFGPLAVTTELPVLDPAGVRDRVRHARDYCRGRARLFLFTSNTINPDVPVANIRALHDLSAR